MLWVYRGFREGSERVQRGFNEVSLSIPSLNPLYTISNTSLYIEGKKTINRK